MKRYIFTEKTIEARSREIYSESKTMIFSLLRATRQAQQADEAASMMFLTLSWIAGKSRANTRNQAPSLARDGWARVISTAK